MRNKINVLGLSVLFLFFFSGCATMFRTNQTSVIASSGANANVQVMENGMLIYNGTLPAQFAVKSGRTYVVQYTLANGEARTITIGEKFNGWFIGSILWGLLPAVVDLVTGSVMTLEKSTILPIAYFPMIIIGENIPNHENFKIIGNFILE